MSTFILKIIALVCMIIDHIGHYMPDMPVQMRWIGRISAPLFIFCLCEGVEHTHSQKRYLLRLYIGSVVMAVIQVMTKINANIFRTLFSIALILMIIQIRKEDRKKGNLYLMLYFLCQVFMIIVLSYAYLKIDQSYIVRALIPALTCSIAFTEGGLPFIFLGVIIYLTKNDKKKMAVSYIAFCVLYAVLSISPLTTYAYTLISSSAFGTPRILKAVRLLFYELANAFMPGRPYSSWLFKNYQWMMVFSLPFMLGYNGERGRSAKWFFYVFYPVHLVVLVLLQRYLT